MCSGSRAILITAAAMAITAGIIAARHRPGAPPPVTHLAAPPMMVREITPDPATLRVCADPNNLPFSNVEGEGFENAIAQLAGRELGKRVVYYWLPQRRGFVRNSLRAGLCDLIVGVPLHYDLVRTTRPYYRSSYVFVVRTDHPRLDSFDDAALRKLTIGIQVTGDDYQNPPPALALAGRHLGDNVRGYTVYGDYSQPDPQRRVIDDVSAGLIDTAVVWGPTAGYFARRYRSRLVLVPVRTPRDRYAGDMSFDIAMGVRRDDAALQQRLNRFLAQRDGEIQRILRRFAVPLARAPAAGDSGGASS